MPAAKPCFYLPYGGADGTRTHDRRVANRTTGKTLGICLSKVAATKRNQWFSRSFPFLTIAYTSRPVFFGHVLATWNWGKPPSVETTLLEVKMNSHSCEHWRSNGDNWSSASLVANPGEILRGSEDPHVTQYASRNFAIERKEAGQRQDILIVLKLISNESSLQADGPCVAHVAKLNVNLVLGYLCNPQALQSWIGGKSSDFSFGQKVFTGKFQSLL